MSTLTTTGIWGPPETINVGGHSLLSPSNAAQWIECCGAPMLIAQCHETYEEDKNAASEGTRAHKLAARLLDYISRGALQDPNVMRDDWKKEFSGETFDAVHDYVCDARDTMRSTGIFGGPEMGIETPVLCEHIHSHCYGTPDLWINDYRNSRLIIWDYKHGRGWVEVFENWQFLAYAIGLLQLIGVGMNHPDYVIEFRLFQPRAFHPDGPRRVWEFPVKRLQPYLERLKEAAWEVFGRNPQTKPGKHCRYCRGRHACRSAQRVALDAVDYLESPVPINMDAHSLARELETLRTAKDAIDYRLSGIEAQAKATVRRGTTIPGFKIKPKLGNLEWATDPDTVLAIGTASGVDLANKKPMTPTQAIDAGVDEKLIKSLSTRQKRGVELVKADLTLARKVFSK